MSNWGLLQNSFQSDWRKFVSNKKHIFDMNPGRLGVVTTNIALFSKAALNAFKEENSSISLMYIVGETVEENTRSFLTALRESKSKVLFLDFFNVSENLDNTMALAVNINMQREFCISKFSAVYIFAKPSLIQELQFNAPDFWSCVEDRFDMTSWYLDLCVAPILEIDASDANLTLIYQQPNNMRSEYFGIRMLINSIATATFNFAQIQGIAKEITDASFTSDIKADLFYRLIVITNSLDVLKFDSMQILLGWYRELFRKLSNQPCYIYCIIKLAEIFFYRNDYHLARMAYSAILDFCADEDGLLQSCVQCNYQLIQHLIAPEMPLPNASTLRQKLAALGSEVVSEYTRSLYRTSRLSKMIGFQHFTTNADYKEYSVGIFTSEVLSLDIDNLQLGTEILAKRLKLSHTQPTLYKLLLEFYSLVEKFKMCVSDTELMELSDNLKKVRDRTKTNGYRALYTAFDMIFQNISFIINAVLEQQLDSTSGYAGLKYLQA